MPCSGTVTYSLPASTYASYTVTWNVAPLQIVSGQGTKTITVQKSSSSTTSSALITATLSYTGGSTVIQKIVDIGAPYVTSVSGPTSGTRNNRLIFSAQPVFPASQGDYDWMTSPGTSTIYNYRHTCDIIFEEAGDYQVGVRSTSPCTSSGSYMTMNVSISNSYLVSSGTGKQVSVSLSGDAGTAATKTIAYALHNQISGALAASGRISAQGGTLDFGKLPAGIYVLSLDADTGNPDTHKIILK